MHELLAALAQRITTPADPLPAGTSARTVIIARVLTRLANAVQVAVIVGAAVAAYSLCHR